LSSIEIALPTGTPDLNQDGFVNAIDLERFLSDRSNRSTSRVSLQDDRWKRVDYPLGRGIRGLVVEDFDGDEDLDLVTVNGDYGRLLFLNNSGEGFFDTPVVSPAPLGAAAVTSGDLNADTLPDLVIAGDFMLRYTAGTYLNAGDGTFGLVHEATFNTSDRTKQLHPRTLRLADLNEDTNPELIVQSQTSIQVEGQPPDHYLTLLQNLGEGEFVAAAELLCGSGTLTSSKGLVAEDLDGDDDIDLVASTGDRAPLLVEGLGGGGFSPSAKLEFLSFNNLWAVDAADIDLDGDLDLAVCDRQASEGVHFYLNDGIGGFTGDASRRNGGLAPEILHFTDIDSDGDEDLVVIHYWAFLDNLSSLQILLNDGNGMFEDTEPFYTSDFTPFPKWIDSGDLDDDGDTDLVTVDEYNGTLTVFLNQQIPSPPTSDLTGDGKRDFEDLSEFGSEWMTPTEP
jgi:hypothetical protein